MKDLFVVLSLGFALSAFAEEGLVAPIEVAAETAVPVEAPLPEQTETAAFTEDPTELPATAPAGPVTLTQFAATPANHGTYVAAECECTGVMQAALCAEGGTQRIFFSLSTPIGSTGESDGVVLRSEQDELPFSPLRQDVASAPLADSFPPEVAQQFPELREIMTRFTQSRGLEKETLVSDSLGENLFREKTLSSVQAGYSLSMDDQGRLLYTIYQKQRASDEALPPGLREYLSRENPIQTGEGRVTCRMTKL